VIPFHQDAALLLDETEYSSQARILPSYFLRLTSILPKVKNVRDIAFLHGFFEPTLAILHEAVPTWTGRLAFTRDTCSVTVISMDLSKPSHTVIWSVDNLPSSSSKLVPVPKPIGGVLVVGTNSLIHIERQSLFLGVSVNPFAEIETGFPLRTDLPSPPPPFFLPSSYPWASNTNKSGSLSLVLLSMCEILADCGNRPL